MGEKARIYFQRAVYHVCIRGNNRQPILGDESDKVIFLESLNHFKRRFGFKLYGVVVMDNHVHLLIETEGKVNISKIMHAITLSYSVKFRKKYNYSGYVWQGRFRSNIIDGENYIVGCLNYIHNNPVRAGIIAKITDYPWSSYRFYNGLESRIKNMIQLDKYGSEEGHMGTVPSQQFVM